LLITPVSAQRDLQERVLMRDSWLAFDKIALIDVTGVLSNAPKRQLFGTGEHPVSLLLEQLNKARNDRAVKAVVLRINSPGGGVTASELMHDEITHFKRSGKPVIAVLMDVAASGGYYIACACDEIMAQPSTVTGSIGVIMQLFDVSGTMEIVGVHADAVTSGAFKDAGSPFRSMRPEERDIFQTIVNDMYDRFIEVVDRGRPDLDETTVRTLGDGRVYSAKQALDAGLIDRIGTLREAVELAKQRAGVKRGRLVVYQRPFDYRSTYYANAATRSNQFNLLNIDLTDWAGSPTPRFMYLWTPGRP
jgi:protease-4